MKMTGHKLERNRKETDLNFERCIDFMAELMEKYVKAKTGDKTAAATYDGWYRNVYTPTPKTTEEGQG